MSAELRPAVLADRARGALDPRERLLRPPRVGLVLYVPRLSSCRAAPADQGHPRLHRGRLDCRARAGRRGRRPPRAAANGCATSTVRSRTTGGGCGGKRRPQGRFNAGQKLNAVSGRGFALLFAVSGLLLWLGERNTRFRCREHDRPPRRADVRLDRSSPGTPLSGADPPRDPPRPARNDDGLGSSRLGARASPKVDRRDERPG